MQTEKITIIDHHAHLLEYCSHLGHITIPAKGLDEDEILKLLPPANGVIKIYTNLHVEYFGSLSKTAWPGLLLALKIEQERPDCQFWFYSVLPEARLTSVPRPGDNYHVIPSTSLFLDLMTNSMRNGPRQGIINQ